MTGYTFINLGLLPNITSSYHVQNSLPTIPTHFNIVNICSNNLTSSTLIVSPSITMYTLFLGASLVLAVVLSNSDGTSIAGLYAISENELNAFDDFIFFILLVFVSYTYNFFSCFSGVTMFNSSTTFFFLILFLAFCLFLVPTIMLFNFGLYLLISVSGGATTLSIFYEMVLDLIGLISFYLSVFIQLVSLVIIGATFFGYNHLVFEYNFFLLDLPTSQGGFTGLGFSSVLFIWVSLVFEVGHLILMFLAQFAAFCVMVLWLFQFLFTLFVHNSMEISVSQG